MILGIMGAMPEEIAPILEKVSTYKTIKYANNNYYEAEYKGITLIIAYSKIGKVFSTLTASTMIQKFGIEKLLFSGVAGAVNSKLRVGDLVVATKLAQHDLDITAFGHPYGYVPEGKQFIESDDKLRELSQSVAADMGLELLEGTIATGDQFVCDAARKEFIATTFSADALEMEGASVAVVCDALNVPFFILRAISDAADMDASFSFDAFLETSALQSANFVMNMVKKIAKSS